MDFKRRQNLHFCKGDSPRSFLKKLKFFHLLCLSKIDREKLFGDVLNKRKPLKTIKKRVYEKRKIRIFPNGLVHGFGQKFKISLTLIFM